MFRHTTPKVINTTPKVINPTPKVINPTPKVINLPPKVITLLGQSKIKYIIIIYKNNRIMQILQTSHRILHMLVGSDDIGVDVWTLLCLPVLVF